jgi:hypothetical protein
MFFICSIGYFGDIQVLFDVQSADAATLALADGTPLLSYFDPSVSNLTLTSSVLLQRFTVSVTLTGCGRSCLSDRTCLAFSVDLIGSVCELYLAIQTLDNTVSTPEANYYQKILESVSWHIMMCVYECKNVSTYILL